MKFACVVPSNSILIGWQNALIELNHEFVFWDYRVKSTFDFFDEYEPDVIILPEELYLSSLNKCLDERPDVVLVYVNNSDEILIKLGETSKTINVKPALDTKRFFPTKPDKNFGSDIAYVGDYDAEAAKEILPMCHNGVAQIKIYGNGWPVPQCVGSINDEELRKVYGSSKLTIGYHGRDEHYAVAACGGNYVNNNFNIYKRPDLLINTYKDRMIGLLNEIDRL